jgi:hypothetical protein
MRKFPSFLPSFLRLDATAQGELWPPEQSASVLLSSSSFLPFPSLSFYGDHHVHPLISVQAIHSRLIIWFLKSLVFTVWGCKPHAQPPIWRTRLSLFVWLVPPFLSGMGDPTSCYATAGIALRVSGALKSHHQDEVETPSVGFCIELLRLNILKYFYKISRIYLKLLLLLLKNYHVIYRIFFKVEWNRKSIPKNTIRYFGILSSNYRMWLPSNLVLKNTAHHKQDVWEKENKWTNALNTHVILSVVSVLTILILKYIIKCNFKYSALYTTADPVD